MKDLNWEGWTKWKPGPHVQSLGRNPDIFREVKEGFVISIERCRGLIFVTEHGGQERAACGCKSDEQAKELVEQWASESGGWA